MLTIRMLPAESANNTGCLQTTMLITAEAECKEFLSVSVVFWSQRNNQPTASQVLSQEMGSLVKSMVFEISRWSLEKLE
jgi:hypothetical protein